MRVFLSYHTSDRRLAEALRTAITAARPSIDVFMDQTHLRYGHFWQPSLFQEIANADAFVILVGTRVGDWQKAEYYEAHEKKIKNPERFILLPVIIADTTRGLIPNLPGLTQLHWIESTEPAAPEPLAKILLALDGAAAPKPSEPWRTVNPYRGLSALEEQDADFFFGREHKTAEILSAVAAANDRIISLIGNSGVGKTSIVQAGVIASLKRARWPLTIGEWPRSLGDIREWVYLVMRPTDNPIGALSSAFTRLWFEDATDAKRFAVSDTWRERLETRGRLAELVDATQSHYRDLGDKVPERFFLYIDQGEELYSRNPRNTISRFSAILADCLSDPRVVVMTSLRSDFYGYLQANEAVFPVTERIDVPPLAADELKIVLREPPRLLNVSFESEGLVDLLVNGAREQPGALPLLADFMTELWRRMQGRGDGVLRIVEKREVLQLGEALARRADLFVEDHIREVDIVRLFFTRLVTLHEGSEPARRRVFLDACTPAERRIAQELASDRWRLVVTGQEEELGRYVEVAHEVLLREWETLKFWLDDQRSFLLWKTDAEKFYRRWASAPLLQRKDALLFGLTLADALRWARAKPSEVDAHLRSFIVRSAEAKAFGFWNSFIILASLLLFFPFLGVASYATSGFVPVVLGASALSMAAGLTMRAVAGVLFRMTVGTLDLGSRPSKSSARATLKDMLETMRRQNELVGGDVHEAVPPPLPSAGPWAPLDAGERGGGVLPSVARGPAGGFWAKLGRALVGAVLGMCLFAAETALLVAGTGNRREFLVGQGALAIISLQVAILANRGAGASRMRAVFSAAAFMAALLSGGALSLDVLSRSAGRMSPDGLFLGVLGLVLCAYVLFVWRYLARPVAN